VSDTDDGVPPGGAGQPGGLRSGLPPLELARDLLGRIDQGNSNARARKRTFRRSSAAVQLLSLALSGASTIILGLQDLDPWAGLGFSLVAVVTVLSALEPFFAWRSRWVLMEEAQHQFYRLRDDLTYYLAAIPPDRLDPARIDAMFDQYQRIWSQLSERWLEHRRSGGPSH
jgi:hypothetical protein